MDVLVTGATGFIGRAVCEALRARGDRVRVLSRDPEVAARRVPGATAAYALGPDGHLPSDAVAGAGAVVNLAGEPVGPGRWTAGRRERIRASRVGVTRAVVEAVAATPSPPGVLVSASAVGWYGDRGDEVLDESSGPGEGFLASVCRDWEAEALRAGSAGVRVVLPRVGMVLGPGGGALAAMLPAFRLGLGARFGTGRQWMSWIHLADLVALLLRAVDDARLDGPVDAVARAPATHREFTAELARACRRPARLAVPPWALRAALGEAADLVLSSQRVVPARALAAGFDWRYPDLAAALAHLAAAPG